MLDPNSTYYLRTKCMTKISKSSNDYWYPKTLPKQRGSIVNICLTILLIIAVIIYAYQDPDDKLRGLSEAFVYFFIYLLMEIVYRFVLLIEEIKHITSRYGNDYKKLIEELFTFSTSFKVLSFLCIIIIYISEMNLKATLQIKPLIIVTICYLINKLFPLCSLYLMETFRMSQNSGYDYGSGMAYSYFYGYLTLVLDKGLEGDSKDFLELQEEYENRHNVKFAMNKLIILIPQSCNCPRSLKNDFSPSIIEAPNSLPEKRITVAGVTDRVYKNAVYKISVAEKGRKKVEGLERIYVCAEYATPLKTFNDVVQQQSKHSDLYLKLKNDIILQFYLTLRSILDQKGLMRFCELIYFDDKDECGEYLDVGKIILVRIKEQNRLEKSTMK